MANEIIYDSTGQPIQGDDTATEFGGTAAFSFTTDSTASGALSDVKVSLADTTALTDGGSVLVSLYSNNADTTAPDVDLADIGTISDAQLTKTGSNLVDVPVTTSVTLDPNTRYWIELTGSATSAATFNYENGAAGTGTAGEFYEVDNGGPNSNTTGAIIGQVTENVVCFTTGTLIRTARGDRAVESLQVGDIAVTAAGALRPIRWIGHRDIVCTHDTYPVRILAGTYGGGLPERDLFLSPGHPVLVGDHLVPIMCLMNGTTIARVSVERVTYWHVELDAHDIVLAEGLPVESYIDLGSRPWFDGADGALYDPDLALPGMAGRCLPVAIEGPIVEAERRRLDAVLEMSLAATCGWPAGDAMSLGF